MEVKTEKVKAKEAIINNTEQQQNDRPIEIRKLEDISKYLPSIDPADADAEFYDGVAQNGEEIFAICHENQVVGLAIICDETDGYLYVYIFPEFRGRGYGYAAACQAEAQMQAEPQWKITTAYDNGSESARRFAEKCGFRKTFASAIMKYQGGKFEEEVLPVRKYKDEDFVAAFTMEDEAFHRMRLATEWFPDSKLSEPSEEMRKFYADNAEDEYVYLQGDEIVGFAQIDGAELSSVSIKVSWQGEGLGKRFTKYLVNRILEKDAGEPFLYCVVGNNKARKLYEALGFQEISCNAYAEKRITESLKI